MEKYKYNSLSEFAKDNPQEYQDCVRQNFLDIICGEMGWFKIKPNGYWNIKENVLAEARKYKSRSEWRNNCGASAASAKKNGWLEECTEHMVNLKNINGYWTKERCLEDALKYKTSKEWKNNSPTPYSYSFKYGWFEECSAHMYMGDRAKPNGYWTLDTCKEEALKYESTKDWKKGSPTSYSYSFKYGWFEECRKHMNGNKRKKGGYWNIKENVLAEARKYSTKGEWAKALNGGSSSYNSAIENGWFDECISHMVEIFKPSGYWTLEKCLAEARKYKTLKDWEIGDSKSLSAARRLKIIEQCCKHFENYLPNGYWNIKENVLAEARKYKSRSEWSNNSSGSYTSARENGWLEECTSHMTYKCTPSGYWTLEKCLAEARKYTNTTEWGKGHEKSYNAARRNGWMDECRGHMIEIFKLPGYWNNKNLCKIEALKYNNKSSWQKGSSSSYKSAIRNGWMDECTTHMVIINKPSGYWTLERCLEEALKCMTKSEWKNFSETSYNVACKKRWLEECTFHMIDKTTFWTLEKCKEEASKYPSRTKWCETHGTSYRSAYKNGWLDDCTSHMVGFKKIDGYWNIKENVLAEARKYKTLNFWNKNGGGSRKSAEKHGWFIECTEHMVKRKEHKPHGYWKIKENVLADALNYKTKVEWQDKSNGSMKSARKYGWLEECTKHM